MSLDNLNIVPLIERLSRYLQQLKSHVYPHTHVRRKYDGDLFCRFFKLFFLLC